MKDLIVVAQITERSGLIDEYENQLRTANVDFYWHNIAPLEGGANAISMRCRIEYMRAMCLRFRDYDRIIMTDAWDVLFLGKKDEIIQKTPPLLFVSAERNLYPNPSLWDRFTSHSPWRFANNGMLCGNPEMILLWLDWAGRVGNLDILDQEWFNDRRISDPLLCWLDERTSLFYVVSSTQEDGALKMKDGRPWNSIHNTYPNFFHFSGQCPDDRFRAMLRGEIDAL